jgi:ORF6N domain
MPTRPSSPADQLPVPVETIERRIYLIRGQKVMLDSDLAELYRVPTFRLNEAVKRNRKRFPEDFMLQLTAEEAQSLTSQIAMSKAGRGGRRTLPYAFTEHGVAMISSVLNSDSAVQMNILIIRAFVKLRELLATHKDLARKIEELETTQRHQARTQQQHASILVSVVHDIQKLKNPPITRAIGFVVRPRKPGKPTL